jgi:hypothetical protein
MSIRILAGASLLASTAIAFAAPSGAPQGAPAQSPYGASSFAVAGANTQELLSGTYIAEGNGNSTPLTQGGFTTIASSNVKCNHAHGCSFGIESMAQMQTGGGDWAICLMVDGAAVSCQFQGVQSGPSSFVVGNALGFASGIAQGFHTVDTMLYTQSASATYQYFQTNVNVYKP